MQSTLDARLVQDYKRIVPRVHTHLSSVLSSRYRHPGFLSASSFRVLRFLE